MHLNNYFLMGRGEKTEEWKKTMKQKGDFAAPDCRAAFPRRINPKDGIDPCPMK